MLSPAALDCILLGAEQDDLIVKWSVEQYIDERAAIVIIEINFEFDWLVGGFSIYSQEKRRSVVSCIRFPEPLGLNMPCQACSNRDQ